MLKRTIVALAIAALALPAAIQAQVSGTITLRGGEKINGQLIDLGAQGLTVRSGGNDRQIPIDQVSVIDFSGSDMSQSDWDKFSGSSVWLKNGQTVNGQLFDIGGTSPLRITMKTDAGEREFSSNEINRIVLSRPASTGVATSGGSSAQVPDGAGVVVNANRQWTSTGLTVRRGEVLTFNASGEARLGAGGETARPSGTGTDRKIQSGPLPQVPAGALIAKVGNGEPFPIGGPTATVTMPAEGQLYLGLNDDHFDDNEGGFRVDVQRKNRRR